MSVKKRKNVLIASLIMVAAVIFVSSPARGDEKKNWAVTVYGAIQTHSDLGGTFLNPDFDSDYHFLAPFPGTPISTRASPSATAFPTLPERHGLRRSNTTGHTSSWITCSSN